MKIEKCIRLLVQNAVMKLKYLLNLMEQDLFFAENVIENVEIKDFK